VIISSDGSLFQDKKDWFVTEALKKNIIEPRRTQKAQRKTLINPQMNTDF